MQKDYFQQNLEDCYETYNTTKEHDRLTDLIKNRGLDYLQISSSPKE